MHLRVIALILTSTVVGIYAAQLPIKPAPPLQSRLFLSPPSSITVSLQPSHSLRRNTKRATKAISQIKCNQVTQIDPKLYQLDFQINQETVNKVTFRPSEPLELYFLAQYLQERIQSKRKVSVYTLYQALPESLRQQVEMPLTSKEALFRIRDLLWRASFDQLAKYGSRNGNYYLAKDLKQAFGSALYLGQIYELVGKREKVQRLLEGAPDGTSIVREAILQLWHPMMLELSLEDVERIIDLLSEAYQKDMESFFRRYGLDGGLIAVAQDLMEQRHKKLHLSQITSLLGDGSEVAKLLGISDSRFETLWHPKTIRLPLDQVIQILEFVKSEYQRDRLEFIARYGTGLGEICLARRLRDEFGFEVRIDLLHELVGSSSVLQNLMGISDSELDRRWQTRWVHLPLGIADIRFKTEWNVRRIHLFLKQANAVLGWLKKKYMANASDPDQFFSVYSSVLGSLSCYAIRIH